ncbi:c-type cytochrome [Pseudomonas sp. SCB32]|uniref:SorB family sulfite dehydrogenase c-type cytochrome subunit n=1 Tax=Pseudomonas sp. SCB32 TaxID=2653853 RepID=UPI0012650686|nr:c-type cytochrome [Pseudomonas sp. SCB32]
MPAIRFLLALACAGLLAATAVSAEPVSIELPKETARLTPSELPGYAIANQKCTICHSADYILLQPPGMSESQWRGEVAKMQHAYGAPVDDQQADVIAAYLADTYSGKPHAQTVAAQAATPSPAKQDARSLLDANGCLGCHALDRTVVGPAYQAVAGRYRDDPQALQSVTEHIRQGGVGRWGQIPMPPFPALDDAQLKTLAEFILGQPTP